MTDIPNKIRYKDIETYNDYVLGETNRELLLEDSADNLSITDHIVEQVNRSIRIFTRNLDPLIYDRDSIADMIKALAVKSRHSRIEILAFETKRIVSRGHRLVQLARMLSSSIEIRQPEKQYEKHLQAFTTFDEKAYIYHTHADRYDGVANYNDPRETRELEKLFQEIWARSHVSAEMRSLQI